MDAGVVWRARDGQQGLVAPEQPAGLAHDGRDQRVAAGINPGEYGRVANGQEPDPQDQD